MRITGGRYQGRRIASIMRFTGKQKNRGYRPATGRVREAVFSALEARGMQWPCCRVLDLFAGTGSLAFEALSRGAHSALLVENNKQATDCIRQTVRELRLATHQVRILTQDVLTALARPPRRPFDFICIDPPYGKGLLWPVREQVIQQHWLAPGGILLAEVEATLEICPEKGPGSADSPLQHSRHTDLDCLFNKQYGNTRILLWKNLPT